MAALDGKITIERELRPCIVHIPESSYKTWNRKKQEHEIKTVREEEIHKALFHCWSHRSEVVGESALRGGHSAGQISATFAIVEYEDGSVHEVNPQNVRLVDGLINQYAFMEDFNKNVG